MNTEIQGLVTPVITGSDNRNLDSLNKVPNAVRIQSIDLLRGVVMIIMALDHVRDYFHYDVFFYSPTDLTKTSVPLFVTRFITHYCAPVFVFLAGMSAYISGTKKSKKELSFFLWTRG
ncbi:MAG TPA: heparan-alpha-glucosaminide N-acetyltransferase domain-containing protein, partial [Chitinophagaceae bacterium]|nr:heparan-alpha-glucosaminide N-acetyltransferase domain-containing protein [Chitinophagaceae bacterium]